MTIFALSNNFRWIILFFLLTNTLPILGQSEISSKQTLFVEGGGIAPYYSINYGHRILNNEKVSGYLRLGGSVWPDGVAFPAGLSFLWAKNDHHPELTLAMTPNFEGARFWNRDQSDLLLDLVLGLGYRYQPADASFFLGGGIYPFIRLDPTRDELSEKKADLRIRLGGSIGWLF